MMTGMHFVIEPSSDYLIRLWVYGGWTTKQKREEKVKTATEIEQLYFTKNGITKEWKSAISYAQVSCGSVHVLQICTLCIN